MPVRRLRWASGLTLTLMWALTAGLGLAPVSGSFEGSIEGFAQEAPPSDGPGYTQYTLEVTFSPDHHTLDGRATVEFVNATAEALQFVDFLLLANYDREPNPYLDPAAIDALYPEGFDPAWTRVRAVTDAAGTPLQYELLEGPAIWQTYSRRDTLLRVRLPEPLAPRDRVTVVLEFVTKFPHSVRGDRARYRGAYIWRFGWHPIALPEPIDPEREERFVLPAAVYELTLTLPKGWAVAVGADHQDVIRETEAEQTVHALSARPTRSVPLAFGPDYRVYEFPYPDTAIAVYYLPGHEAAARQIATYAIESLQYYQERWGEYPRRRLLIVETPSSSATFAGATGDGLMLLNRQFFSEKDLGVPGLLDRLLDYVLAHEVAHQWWGLGIGVDFNAENVLSEGLAQYFAIAYFEAKYGADGPNVFQIERQGLLERFVETQFGYLNLREHFNELPYMQTVRDRFDEAIVKPQREVKYANHTGERVYNKGYLMLRALQGLLGEATMDELLRTAAERFLHKTLTVRAFQALAEEISGQDLAEFFENAFYRDADGSGEEGRAPYADYGVLRVESMRKPEGGYVHRVTLTRRGRLRLPVEVTVRTRTDGEEQTRIWALEDQLDDRFVMTFETNGPLTEVEVDPKHRVPDVDRLNNVYVLEGLALFNRRVRLIVTGENDLPLEAYLVRFNPVQGVLEGGYLLDHRWWLGQGFAALVKNFERGRSLQGLVGWAGDGLVGQLVWTQTFFSHPETGWPGRFWEPTGQLQLTVLRRPDATGLPSLDKLAGATGRLATVFGATWRHRESVNRRLAYWGSLLIDPMAFTRVELGFWQGLRLYPHVTLGVGLRFGWGEGTLGIFQFNLGELRSFVDAEGYPFFAPVRLLGQIDVTFPLQRDLEFNILGFALAREVSDRFYLRLGRTWDSVSELSLDGLWNGLKAELGAEWRVEGTTLGGLLPWRLTFGLVYALTPVEEGQNVIKFYYRVWTPLF